jgi:integrase
VSHVPTIHRFPEDNARQGFLSRADFEALLENMVDPDIRDFVEWCYWTGMLKGEAARLTWEMFDRETWTLGLHQSAAKTGKGRALVLAAQTRTGSLRRPRAVLGDSDLSTSCTGGMAEAGGNRTHRSGDQPGAGRL